MGLGGLVCLHTTLLPMMIGNFTDMGKLIELVDMNLRCLSPKYAVC